MNTALNTIRQNLKISKKSVSDAKLTKNLMKQREIDELVAINWQEPVEYREVEDTRIIWFFPLKDIKMRKSSASSKYRETFYRQQAARYPRQWYQIRRERDYIQTKTPANRDIPVVEAFVDMGLIQEPDHKLTKMDKAHFTECCTVSYVTGKPRLLAFHEKRSVDVQKPYHLREDVIRKWIGQDKCSLEDANSLSNAWKKLGLGAGEIKRLIFGYFDTQKQVWRSGLRAAGKPMAAEFEQMANAFSDQHGKSLEEFRREAFTEITGLVSFVRSRNKPEPSATQIMHAIEKRARRMWNEHKTKRDELEQALEFYDDNGRYNPKNHSPLSDELDYYEDPDAFGEYFMDRDPNEQTASDQVFGAHPLFDESDDLPNEDIYEIMTADLDKLNQIKSEMFPGTGYYGQKTSPKRWYPKSQVGQFWQRIKDREEKLFKDAIDNLSTEVKDLINRIFTCESAGYFKVLKAEMACAFNGQLFDGWIQYKKANAHEVTALRLAYKEKAKEFYKK